MSVKQTSKGTLRTIRCEPVVWRGAEKSPFFEILDAFFSQKKWPDAVAGMLGYPTDEITGEEIRTGPYCGWGSFMEGGFYWTQKDLYHFYTYHMPLDPDFIAFVLNDYRLGLFRVKTERTRRHGKAASAFLRKKHRLEFRLILSRPGRCFCKIKAERRRKKREALNPLYSYTGRELTDEDFKPFNHKLERMKDDDNIRFKPDEGH